MNLISTPGNEEQHFSSMIMFEEIVSKNFQILRNILPRMNSLYQLNEELQRSVSNIQQKLTKLEQDNQNLHYEMRTDHLAMQKKISKIANNYKALNKEARIFNFQTQPLTKLENDSKINPYQKSNITKEDKKQQKNRRIIFKDEANRKPLNSRNSIQLQTDEIQQNSKVQFNKNSNASIEKNMKISKKNSFNSAQDLNSRRSNLKNNSKLINAFSSKLISQGYQKFDNFKNDFEKNKNGVQIDQRIKKCQQLLSKQQKENSQYFKVVNQKINLIIDKINPQDNLSKVIQKISSLYFQNKNNANNENNNTNKRVKQTDGNSQDIGNCNSMTISNKDKNIQEQKIHLININKLQDNAQDNTQNNIDILGESSFQQYLTSLENDIRRKVDKLLFNSKIEELNGRLTDLHGIVSKYANKQQTKRAIQYLENKINTIFQQENEIEKKSIHVVEVNKKGFFRPHQRRNSQIRPPVNTECLNSQRKQKIKPTNSLHTSVKSGSLAQYRFNQERKTYYGSKYIKSQQPTPQQSQNTSILKLKDITLLKQKSVNLLQKGKKKLRTKLKKEKFFHYD